MKHITLVLSLILLTSFRVSAQKNNDLFFVFLNSNPEKAELSKEKVDALQAAHLDNIAKLAEEGKLLAAGPFDGGGGMFILDAKDQFQAWDYLNTDPAIKANRYKVEVIPFDIWNGNLTGAKKPYEMVNYQFIRLMSNPDFGGDEKQLIHDNRIFMAEMMSNNEEVIVYGFFSEFNDGMTIIDSDAQTAEALIKGHPSIKAGQLKYEIKTLYIAKGTFGE